MTFLLGFLVAMAGMAVAGLIHAQGHLLACRLVGIRPREYSLGTGDIKESAPIPLTGGLPLVSRTTVTWPRLRFDENPDLGSWSKRLIMVLGGPLANYLCAALAFMCLGLAMPDAAKDQLPQQGLAVPITAFPLTIGGMADSNVADGVRELNEGSSAQAASERYMSWWATPFLLLFSCNMLLMWMTLLLPLRSFDSARLYLLLIGGIGSLVLRRRWEPSPSAQDKLLYMHTAVLGAFWVWLLLAIIF